MSRSNGTGPTPLDVAFVIVMACILVAIGSLVIAIVTGEVDTDLLG